MSRRVLPVLALAACTATPPAPAPTGTDDPAIVVNPSPELPSVRPPIHLMESGAFLRPTIPPHRTSSDGRLALSLTKVGGDVSFGLYAPERLTTSWIDATPGVIGLAPTSVSSPIGDYYLGGYVTNPAIPLPLTDHRTICDGWPVPDPVGGRVQNPYPCADDASLDCYDITVVSSLRKGGKQIELHGKPVRVKVSDPKLATAAVVAVDTAPAGAPAVTKVSLVGDYGLEPMITSDGHLLVMRLGDVKTTNPVTGGLNEIFDIVYLASDPTELRCDVTAWNQWFPVTHAHHDVANAMPDRYGFARYPLRDAKGVAFTDGEDFGASYPWIDREGNNLFFTLISSTLWYQDTISGLLEQRYGASCVGAPGSCTTPASTSVLDDTLENSEQFRGFAFAGLWSRGKVVMLDNLANNTDYGLGRKNTEQRQLALYDGGATSVRVGTGRDNNANEVPAGAVDNTSLIDSWEHLFNHDADVRPITVRDVVWIINTGKATVELAFDDYLDKDAVILTDGNAATTKTPPYAGTNQPTYLDGFVQTDDLHGTVGHAHDREAYFTTEAELANAATSTAGATPSGGGWAVPPSGILEGNLRIEPVALGGVVGKGLWLPGDQGAVRYDMPAQATSPTARTISMFLDPRFDVVPGLPVVRRLLTFPDNTTVDLVDLSSLRYTRNGVTNTVSLAAHPLTPGAWNHLAWVVTGDGATVSLFLDGYLFHSITFANGRKLMNVLPRTGGVFRVGLSATGVKGWIDEVKVFARALDPESVCNQGRGTLASITAAGDPTWWAIAGQYTTHGVLRTLLGGGANTKYVCVHDYADPDRALLSTLPAGSTSVRAPLLALPSLHAALPRPDSSTTPFCLSCHVADSFAPASLTSTALVLDPALAAQDDPRRQPLQTPARIFGNVPLDFFRNAAPTSLTNAELDADPIVGERVDPYVLP